MTDVLDLLGTTLKQELGRGLFLFEICLWKVRT